MNVSGRINKLDAAVMVFVVLLSIAATIFFAGKFKAHAEDSNRPSLTALSKQGHDINRIQHSPIKAGIVETKCLNKAKDQFGHMLGLTVDERSTTFSYGSYRIFIKPDLTASQVTNVIYVCKAINESGQIIIKGIVEQKDDKDSRLAFTHYFKS